ncbi:basic leucine zipper 24-like [Vigna unguiculata]|uniref:CCAAT/enhancer-binding protein C/EBP n=1 Tax=Vigna unguiculata TaxID=3917 RepID=A0A4D6M4N2_VIGUN|nr:basic leucine zipper 24-like [Vigna unguiculata]XP_027905744.1 basic leucine zipper 24-like [Vigna unguiculata]XP_027905782.1 basic leucine zipper 24-like [Vigna unguiculata]XP_027905825.1 basic leucine zipper 24-like [Vigna unguiculata]XP_027905862.1 basic leucine zipper 24-like [Vigna unguiculata]QCD95787.1 CCAAT/enhancer-binding protein C/EBP [Vigna unguiculata]
MDDGNAELSDKLSNNVLFLNPESSSSFQASTSVNTVPELCRSSSRTCTHTHTCNPPGPDAAHTHTCYHTHTQIFAPEDDHHKEHHHTNSKPKRPSGNREAVRKYREKKKAHTAYLEEEVKKLRLVNQQLARKLQGQALLEAELARLRSILAHLKGKIDSELGAFPFQKQCNSYISKEGNAGLLSTARTIGLECQNNMTCFHPHAGSSSQANICAYGKSVSPWEGNCQPEIVDCDVDANNLTSNEGQTVETVDNFLSSASQE